MKFTKEDCIKDIRLVAFREQDPSWEEKSIRWFFFETIPGYYLLLLIAAVIRILEACEVH